MSSAVGLAFPSGTPVLAPSFGPATSPRSCASRTRPRAGALPEPRSPAAGMPLSDSKGVAGGLGAFPGPGQRPKPNGRVRASWSPPVKFYVVRGVSRTGGPTNPALPLGAVEAFRTQLASACGSRPGPVKDRLRRPLDGLLIDGRNRLKACQMAGVEPRLETYDGDVEALVVSANVNRRHLSAGQRAMAVAMLYPDPGKGGRGKKSSTGNLLVSGGFSRQRLDQARSVLRYSEPLAREVLAGSKSLDAALAEAQSADGKLANDRSRLRKLKDNRPDPVFTSHQRSIEYEHGGRAPVPRAAPFNL